MLVETKFHSVALHVCEWLWPRFFGGPQAAAFVVLSAELSGDVKPLGATDLPKC